MSRSGQDRAALTEAETLFAQVLQLFPRESQDGSQQPVTEDSAVLDPSSGLATRFCQVCRERQDALDETQLGPSDVVTSWQLEQNTWDLIADLYLDRAAPDYEGPSLASIISNNPYTPESAIVRQALEASPLLNELLLVRNWLQRTAPPPNEPDTQRGYWRYTKLELMHQLRSSSANLARTRGASGAGGRPFVNSLAKELDPDVISRSTQAGSPAVLDPKDAEFEKTLSQTLFHYIRAGDLDQAIALCRNVDQPWRSVALRGAKAFSWDQIGSEDNAVEEDTVSTATWSGNPRRKLWRKTCQAGAASASLSPSARLLLASLAPSSTTLPILSQGLQTWEDHLWARVSALLEDRVDALLARSGNSYWNSRSAISSSSEDVMGMEDEDVDGDEDEAAFEEQIEAVLREVEHVKTNNVFDFRNRFHWAQYYIILDRTEEMFAGYAAYLSELEPAQAQSSDHLQQLRFFAHLCLFLRQLGRDVPLDAANVIIQAYISHLEEQRRGDLVALYVGALGENAIQRYATFLSKLSVDISRHERLIALNRAREHGLDVEAVAFSTASLIAREELKKLPSYAKELPSPEETAEREIEPEERVLCRSVEWLTFHSGNYSAALRQANALMRYFLGFARIPAARELFLSVPPEVTSEAVDIPVEGPELLHFRHFFEVWDGFAALDAVKASEPVAESSAQKLKTIEWRKQYGTILDNVRESCIHLFTSGWLEPLNESDYDDRRTVEIRRLREIYVPEIVLRLHNELMAGHHLFPECIPQAYGLATIVADARYALYEDFFTSSTKDGRVRNRMPEYIYALRETAIAALEAGHSDPFSVLDE